MLPKPVGGNTLPVEENTKGPIRNDPAFFVWPFGLSLVLATSSRTVQALTGRVPDSNLHNSTDAIKTEGRAVLASCLGSIFTQ